MLHNSQHPENKMNRQAKEINNWSVQVILIQYISLGIYTHTQKCTAVNFHGVRQIKDWDEGVMWGNRIYPHKIKNETNLKLLPIPKQPASLSQTKPKLLVDNKTSHARDKQNESERWERRLRTQTHSRRSSMQLHFSLSNWNRGGGDADDKVTLYLLQEETERGREGERETEVIDALELWYSLWSLVYYNRALEATLFPHWATHTPIHIPCCDKTHYYSVT